MTSINKYPNKCNFCIMSDLRNAEEAKGNRVVLHRAFPGVNLMAESRDENGKLIETKLLGWFSSVQDHCTC